MIVSFDLVPYGTRAVSPRYMNFSFGREFCNADSTVSPPTPESNTPIGKSCFILYCLIDLNQLCLVREGVKVLPFIKGISERVILEHNGEKHTFRPELYSVLKEIETYSNTRKPFLVEHLKEATDNFERISLAHHLRDLKLLDPVQYTKRRR